MDDELAGALGHLRQAAHQLLRTPDPAGRTLALAVQVLDIESLLDDLGVQPSLVPPSASADASVRAAARLLAGCGGLVPLEVWPALQRVLGQASDYGHR